MIALHPSLQQILMAQIESVQSKFPGAEFYWPDGDTAYIEFSTEATNGQYFTLRLFFQPEFPEICPRLVIWDPIRLPDQRGGYVNDHDMSHSFHTLDNWDGGRVEICHMNTGNWDAAVSFLLPIIKGVVWCEAYTTYMDQGGEICDYLAND